MLTASKTYKEAVPMLTLFTLSLICLVTIPVLVLVMALFSIPFLVIMAILPWALRVAAVVLLVRALMEQPFRLESLIPAAIAFGLSVLLR